MMMLFLVLLLEALLLHLVSDEHPTAVVSMACRSHKTKEQQYH